MAIQDRDLVYQWAFNQQTRRPDEIIGKTYADLFAPEEVVWINEVKQRVLETGKEVHLAHWVTSNGRRLFLDVSYEPLRDSAGQVHWDRHCRCGPYQTEAGRGRGEGE